MSRELFARLSWWVVAVLMAGYATPGLRVGPGGKPLNAPITVGQAIVFAFVFCVIVGLGKLTAHVASRKGYDYFWWSWYGLLLGCIALPHVLLKKAKPPSVEPGGA